MLRRNSRRSRNSRRIFNRDLIFLEQRSQRFSLLPDKAPLPSTASCWISKPSFRHREPGLMDGPHILNRLLFQHKVGFIRDIFLES